MTQRAIQSLLAVALLALAAPGCVFMADDDHHGGEVELTWELAEAGTGAPVTCAPGETVQTAFAEFVDVFDCDDYGGVTAPIPEGTYLARFRLVDPGGVILSETSFSVPVFDGDLTDAGHLVFVVD